MASPRSHGRDSFFKFVTPDTAKVILQTSSFRWSSPEVFNELNDPFDVPKEFAEGISAEDFRIAFKDRYIRLLKEPSTWNRPYGEAFRGLLNAAKNVSAEQFPNFLRSVEELEWPPAKMAGMEEMRSLWRKMRPLVRILCLAENPSSPNMWLHYGGNYSGAVIEVGCMDLLDSAWNAAEQITYSDEPSRYRSAAGWVDSLLLEPMTGIRDIFSEFTLKKAKCWEAEKEYRVVTFARDGEVGSTSDWKFNPSNVRRVILGHKYNDVAKRHMIRFLLRKYPWAKIQQTELGSNEVKFKAI